VGKLVCLRHKAEKCSQCGGFSPHIEAEPVPVTEQEQEAGDILRTMLKSAHNIDALLVMGTDKDGTLGFLTNLDGTNEVLAFMRKVEFKILQDDATPKPKPIGGGTA
jgi:hypothetical protein